MTNARWIRLVAVCLPALLALIGGVLVAPAAGGITATYDPPVNVGYANGIGLFSVTVHLKSDTTANNATALSGRFDGPMYQVWVNGSQSTPTATAAGLLTPAQQAMDTHLLLSDSQLLVARSPTENGAGVGSWLAWTSTQNMAVGFQPSAQAMDLALAQIVIPAGHGTGTSVVFTGSASNKAGTKFALSLTLPAICPGDTNLNGAVNIEDLTTLAANYGGSGKTWATGDFNGDGVVNIDDLTTLAANYGVTAGSDAPIVPEPAALSLLALGGLTLLRRRRRGGRRRT